MAEQFFESCLSSLRQGDIFAPLRFAYLSSVSETRLTEREYSALLLNQSCDVDKKHPKLVMLPVFPLSVQNSQNQNLIKKNRMFSCLYLPSYRDEFPESFVSFLEPMTIERSLVENATRIISLNAEGKRAFYVQYTRWLTRWHLTEIPCPNCGVNFNPAVTLPIENS